MKPKIIKLNNLEDTQKLAESLAIKAAPNMNFLLRGDLGAGKTTFTKYLLKALGVTSSVTSPTFVILNQYQGQDLLINHVDAYRLDKNQNVDFIVEEFDDAFNVIEWDEHLNYDFSKTNYLVIEFTITDDFQHQAIVKEA